MTAEKVNKYLLTAIKIGILVILFLPFVVGSKFFFPFIVLKNVLFRLTVEILFLLYVILAVREPRFRPKFNLLTLSVLVFFAIVAGTTFTGIGLRRAIWGNYERMGGLWALGHLLLYFLILISVFKDKRDWHSFFTFSIFTSFLITFFGLAQKLNVSFLLASSGESRLTGTIGNASYLAAYLIFNLFFLLYFIFKEKYFNLKFFVLSVLGVDVFLILFDLYSKIFRSSENIPSLWSQIVSNKRLLLAMIIIQLITFGAWFLRKNSWLVKSFLALLFLFELFIFFWTQTRGAVIGFWFGIFILILLNLRNLNNQALKRTAVAVMAILIILPILLFTFRGSRFIKSNETLNRLASISRQNVSTQNRLLVWNASLKGWLENPIRFLVGFGQENYYYAFNKHFPSELFQDLGSRIWFDRAHNVILDTGITSGLIGLVSYLSIFVLALYFLMKQYFSQPKRLIFSILVVLLIAYFVQNLFVFDTLDTSILFFLILAFIAAYLWESRGEKFWFWQSRNKFWEKITVAAAFVFVGFGIFNNFKLLKANHYIYQALQAKKSQNVSLEKILGYHQKSIQEAVTGRDEAREQLANYALQLLGNPKVSEGIKVKAMTLTIDELKKNVIEEPTHVRHYLYVASVINRASISGLANSRQAIDYLERAMPLSPTRPQIYFELGQAYLLQKDFANGVANFEKGVSLSDWVIDSHLDLAIAYLVTGSREKSLAEIQQIKDKFGDKVSEDNYLRLVKSAEKVKDFPLLIDLYQNLIFQYPDKVEYYAQLAYIYAYLGENKKAEELAEKVLAIDPSRQAETQAFLEKLRKGELKQK